MEYIGLWRAPNVIDNKIPTTIKADVLDRDTRHYYVCVLEQQTPLGFIPRCRFGGKSVFVLPDIGRDDHSQHCTCSRLVLAYPAPDQYIPAEQREITSLSFCPISREEIVITLTLTLPLRRIETCQ